MATKPPRRRLPRTLALPRAPVNGVQTPTATAAQTGTDPITKVSAGWLGISLKPAKRRYQSRAKRPSVPQTPATHATSRCARSELLLAVGTIILSHTSNAKAHARAALFRAAHAASCSAFCPPFSTARQAALSTAGGVHSPRTELDPFEQLGAHQLREPAPLRICCSASAGVHSNANSNALVWLRES